MSNPTTNFLVGGTDLSSIFQPLSLGTPYGTATGYKVGGQDFNDIFAVYPGSGTKASSTGYYFGGNDLCNIFAKYNPSPYTPYTISNSSNLTFTEYNNNGYTGLVFEVDSSTNNAIASITFNIDISNVVIIIVGGGGGGFSDGGGGGGTTYLINYDIQKNITYSIQVGKGGTGYILDNPETLPTSGSESYFNDNNTNYIGYGGTDASSSETSLITYSGNGGNSSSVEGGGGGSGGGYLYYLNYGGNQGSVIGAPGSNNNGYNLACQGKTPPVNKTGGNGGDSFYKYVYIPFLQNISSLISVGGGGGGGGDNGQNFGGSNNGGNAGQGIGGNGCSTNGGSGSVNGGNGTNSITTGYGGGGGAFGMSNYNPDGNSGNGGNGVVIIYYGLNPIKNFITNGTITISTNYWFVIFTDTNNTGNIVFTTNNNVEVNYLIVGGGGSGGAGGQYISGTISNAAIYSGGGGSSGQIVQGSTTIIKNSIINLTLGKGGACPQTSPGVFVPSNGEATVFNGISASGGNYGQNGQYQYPNTPQPALGGASVGNGEGGNGSYNSLLPQLPQADGSNASGYNNIYANFTVDNINLGTFGGGGGGGGFTNTNPPTLQYFGQGSGANGSGGYLINLSGFNGGGGGGAVAISPSGPPPPYPTLITAGGNGGDGIVILWFSKNIS